MQVSGSVNDRGVFWHAGMCPGLHIVSAAFKLQRQGQVAVAEIVWPAETPSLYNLNFLQEKSVHRWARSTADLLGFESRLPPTAN